MGKFCTVSNKYYMYDEPIYTHFRRFEVTALYNNILSKKKVRGLCHLVSLRNDKNIQELHFVGKG